MSGHIVIKDEFVGKPDQILTLENVKYVLENRFAECIIDFPGDKDLLANDGEFSLTIKFNFSRKPSEPLIIEPQAEIDSRWKDALAVKCRRCGRGVNMYCISMSNNYNDGERPGINYPHAIRKVDAEKLAKKKSGT